MNLSGLWRILESLKALGEMLKNKREEMHLSLKEVENGTSIRQLYLQAIEEGRAQQFLSPVYALGFIKQYAIFLGYDPEQLIRENPKAFQIQSERQEFSYGIGTLESRNTQNSPFHAFPNLFWAGATTLALIAAWYLSKFLGLF